MEKILTALLLIALIAAIPGCSRRSDAPVGDGDVSGGETIQLSGLETESVPFDPVIDSILFDLDGNGVPEDCTMTYGPTSGLFTVVISASEKGVLKYRNTFHLSRSVLGFSEKDGALQILTQTHDFLAGKTRSEALGVLLDGGRIVLDGLDPDLEGYWGDSQWNLF